MEIKKYKSVGFWIGIFGIILVATGNEIGDFTTWGALADYVLSIIKNPATLVGIFLAVYGNWNTTNKKGIN